MVRVLFTIAGPPETLGGAEATRTAITVANRTGQGVQPRSDSPAHCTVVLPTEGGGLIQVRLDSAGAEVCGRTERVTSVLAPALPA